MTIFDRFSKKDLEGFDMRIYEDSTYQLLPTTPSRVRTVPKTLAQC